MRGFKDNVLQCFIHGSTIDQELDVALDRGLPLGKRNITRLFLFLSLGRLVFPMKLHGHEPHLLHEPFVFTRVEGFALLHGGRCTNHTEAPASLIVEDRGGGAMAMAVGEEEGTVSRRTWRMKRWEEESMMCGAS